MCDQIYHHNDLPFAQPAGLESAQNFPGIAPLPAAMFDGSVDSRNALQRSGRVHPRTCGNDRTDAALREYQPKNGGDFGQLVAVEAGWKCPVCNHHQPLFTT